MLELIGFAVVIYIVWRIIKAVSSGAVRATMMLAVEYASTHGVPMEKAYAMVMQREIMKKSVQIMSKQDPNFRKQDVHVQYGKAIVMMWEGYQCEQRGGK